MSYPWPFFSVSFCSQTSNIFFFFTGFCYYDTLPPCRTTAIKPADDNPETSQIMKLNTPFLPLGFPILKNFVSDAKWLIEGVKRKCEHSRRIYRGERSRQEQPECPRNTATQPSSTTILLIMREIAMKSNSFWCSGLVLVIFLRGGWSFSGTGKCLNIRECNKVENRTPGRLALHSICNMPPPGFST